MSGYRISSNRSRALNTNRASNTGRGSNVVVLIEAGGFYSRKYGTQGYEARPRPKGFRSAHHLSVLLLYAFRQQCSSSY